jgi:hypothetical protein
MGIVLVTTFGLLLWIVLWAQGIKAFDAFLITIALVLLAVIGRMLMPLLPGNRDE